jgi:hypothetical protein
MHLGASAGLGLLLTSVGGPPYALYTDFYIDILNLRLETNFEQWSIFLQIELKYGLEMGTNLYGKSWYTSWDFLPPLTVGFVKKW